MAGPAPGRSASWRPILLLVLLAPLLLGLVALLRAGGGRLPVDSGVDWSAYPPEVHNAIDRATRNLDCAGLAEQRRLLTSGARSSPDPAPVVAYIDSIRGQLVCPG